MDENSMRALLDRVADDDLPPTRVDIPMITRRGRRSLWLRRVYLPSLAPIAAATAVALAAALGAGPGNPHHAGKPSAPVRHALMPVPRQFGPLQPFVSFGWLPAGFTPDGLAQPAGRNVTLGAAAPSADGRTLILALNAAGTCRLTGKKTFRLPQLGRDSTKWVTLTYPHSLNCGGGPGRGLPVTAKVAPIDGGPAYRGPQGDLIWEFGKDAWARLTPLFSAYLTHHDASPAIRTWLNFPAIPQLRPPGVKAPVWHQSAASWNALRTIAERLRYAARNVPAPLYAFRIAALPPGWRVSAPADLERLGGKIASNSWSAGPADDPGALSISIWPAAGATPLTCNYIDGQSSHVTLDGAQAVLRTIDQPYKHWQSLCGPDIDGMQVLIELDLNIPGTSDKPLPGGSQIGNAVTVFGHLTLLGSNVANWTTRPPG